jgi:hypothetical protein
VASTIDCMDEWTRDLVPSDTTCPYPSIVLGLHLKTTRDSVCLPNIAIDPWSLPNIFHPEFKGETLGSSIQDVVGILVKSHLYRVCS